ncbi:MAG TPA: hypothetical protein VF788_11910 [Pseudonocardiaceae bacterium]
MSDVSAAELVEQLRHANARLRELLAARDAEIEALRLEKDAENAELRAVVTALMCGPRSWSVGWGRAVMTPEYRHRKSRSRPRPDATPNARPVGSRVGVVRRGSARRTDHGVGSRAIPGMA